MSAARRFGPFFVCVIAGVVSLGVVPGQATPPLMQPTQAVNGDNLRSEEGLVPTVAAADGPRGVPLERTDPAVLEAIAAAARAPGPSVSFGPQEVPSVRPGIGPRVAAVELVPPGDADEVVAKPKNPEGDTAVKRDEPVVILSEPPSGSTSKKRSKFDPNTSVRSRRTATSEAFDNSDGSKSLVLGNGKAGLDEKGSVVDADTALTVQPGGRFRMRAGLVRADIANELRDGTDLFAVGAPGERVGFVYRAPVSSAKGAVRPGKAKGSSVTYDDAFGSGTSLELNASSFGVKESIVLGSVPAKGVKPEFRFGLNLEGYVARLNASGSVSLLDSKGSEQWVVPAGLAWELPKPGQDPSVFGKVSFALETAADGTTTLVVQPDEAWLRDPARRFPVIVDPTITPGKDSSANQAAFVAEYLPDSHMLGCGPYTRICFGPASFAPPNLTYGYLRFDVQVLQGQNISSAILRLGSATCPSYPQTVTVRPLASPVDMSAVTFNTRPVARSVAVQGTVAAAGDFSVDVTALVAKWASGEWPAYGFQLEKTGTSCNVLVQGTGASYLEVTYAAPTTATNRPPTVPIIQSPADGATVSSPVTFSATSNDPDGDPVRYQFVSCLMPCAVGSGRLVSPLSSSTSWNGTSGNPGEYWAWYVEASDGIAPYVWSGWRYFTFGTPAVVGPGEGSEWGTSSAYSKMNEDIQPNAAVNTGTKRLVFRATDAQVAAAGPALAIERTYNSGDGSIGVFGTGWSSILDARVDADVNGNLTFRLPDGRREFHPLVGGEYRTAPGYWTTADVDPGGGWTLLEKDGSVWRFRTDGRFLQVADRNGRALVALFDSSGKQTSLRINGRTLTFTWTGAFITSVSDSLGQSWNYGYVGNYLSKVCDPRNNNLVTGLCTTYTYDAGNRINAVTKPKGNRDFEVGYYPDGTVNWRRDGMGFQTTYTYNVATKTSTVTDPAGRVTTEVYNGYRQIVSRTEPGDANIPAHTTTFTYDSNGFLAKRTSPVYGSWEYVNDYRGNPVQVKDPTGATSYYDYDTRDLVMTYRSAYSSGPTDNAYRWTYGYDVNGNRVRETNPYGWSRTWTYYSALHYPAAAVPNGVLIAEMDWNGNTTSYTYNTFGDLTQILYPGVSGDITNYSYDALGRKTLEGGRIQTPGITYSYDALNAPLTITEPPITNTISGLVRRKQVTITYDANHLKMSETISDIGGSTSPDATQTTTYGYDNNDRETTRTDPLNGVTTRRFTNVGTVDRVTDARGNYTETIFNARDLPQEIRVRNADPVQGTDTVLTVETRSYDAAGRMTGNTTTDGGTRTYTYDGMNRPRTQTLIGFVDRNGVARNIIERNNFYDPFGTMRVQQTGNGTSTTQLGADSLGRTVAWWNETRYSPLRLDRNGNTTRREFRVAGGGPTVVLSWEDIVYDPRNRPTSRSVTMGGDGADRVTTIGYSKWGTPTLTTDARGNAQSFFFDNLGRLIKSTAPSVSHEATGGTAIAGAMEMKYGYDTFGNRTHVTDGRGFTTVSTYDKLNRAVRTDQPTCTSGCQTSAAFEQWTFDAVGNTTAYRDRRGQTTNFDFDSWNRVVRKTLPALGAAPRATETVKYNAQSQPIEAVNAIGAKTTTTYNQMSLQKTVSMIDRFPATVTATSTMDYNDRGQLNWVRDPFNNVTTNGYLVTGEKTQTVDPTGATWNWTYDSLGRQTSATDPAGKSVVTTYNRASEVRTVQRRDATAAVVTTSSATYDNNSNQITTVDNRGNSTTMTYDAMNRLVSVGVPGTGTVTYGYDRAGNLTRSTNGRGFATTYAYNEWNLQTSTVEPSTTAHPAIADRTFTTTFDAAGLPVATGEPGATVARTFNELGALTGETGSGAGLTTASRTFTRDAAGRVLTASHPNGSITFSYNDKDQIIAATGAAGASGFTYDVKGRMTGRTDVGTALTAQAYAFSYTARDELLTAQDHLLAARTYNWRNDGLLNTVIQGATTRALTYDSIGRMAADTLKVTASNTTLNAVIYGYDADDNVTSRAVTAAGNPGAGSNGYGYDAAGRLTSWTNPASVVTTYGYDNAGNRTSAGAQTFSYDERNRLTAGTGLTNVWSARGSLSSSTQGGVTTTYNADGLNRVVGVSRGATALAFSYDAFDRPWRRTANATVSNEFSYAGAEIDAVMTATSTAQKSVYGRSPTGRLLSGGVIGGARASIGYDRHGDATLYFDPTAASVSGTRLFDPFGKPSGTSGSTLPELGVGFQADWTDPLTGDVNMGARWYDPNTAVFRTRDTVFGMLGSPVTLNRYTYAGNNPVKYWDASGREFSIDFSNIGAYFDPETLQASLDYTISQNPDYRSPPPQEPTSYTYASGTGAYTTQSTDAYGNTTFVVTAATGVTVSSPATTERSGNLSYSPTAAAHVAAVVLADQGLSAGAIAGAIDDAVAVVGSNASTSQIESAAFGELSLPLNSTSETETADLPSALVGLELYSSGGIAVPVNTMPRLDVPPKPKPAPRPPGKLGQAVLGAFAALSAACAANKVDCTPKPAPGGGGGSTTTVPRAPTGPCDSPEDDPDGEYLYHYTTLSNMYEILDSCELYPSKRQPNGRGDAVYGNGQYLTSAEPGSMSGRQLSNVLVRNPDSAGRFTNYVKINVKGFDVIQPSAARPGIFLIRNEGPLDLIGRIGGYGQAWFRP
jgi:RHS repeat-associated protein